eukprot:4331936-Amphidinium_carterae.1
MRENNEVNTCTLRLELSVAMSEQAKVSAAYLCRRSRRQSELTDEISHSNGPVFDSKMHHADLKAIQKRAHVIVMGLLRDDRVDVLEHYKEHGQ